MLMMLTEAGGNFNARGKQVQIPNKNNPAHLH